MSYTVTQIISIAKYSQTLALLAINKGGLYGSGIDLQLPIKIYSIRKTVEFFYDLDPDDDNLTQTANYLYALCAPFNIKAAASLISGGSISPISNATIPMPYDFSVDASSFIATGVSSITISNFIGYNLLFVRNNITQSQVNLGGGSSYFSWNRTTGLFTCSPAATVSELFQLYPFV